MPAGAGAGDLVQVPDAVPDQRQREQQRQERQVQGPHPAHAAAHRAHAARSVRRGGGHGDEHVQHGPGVEQVRRAVPAGQRADAADPGIPGDPVGEPGRHHAEDHFPRRVGQGAQARGQRARHGDGHEQVRDVDVGQGGRPRPVLPGPRGDQAGRADRRDHEHDRGEDVQDPGRDHDAAIPSSARAGPVYAGAGAAARAGQ